MATRSPGQSPGAIRLLDAPERVKAKLSDRIQQGEVFKARAASVNINSGSAVLELRDEVRIWSDYNSSLLPRLFAGPILAEYEASVALGSARSDTVTMIRLINHDLDFYLRKLKSIVARLDLWDYSDEPARDRNAPSNTTAAIFVVHGHDDAKKEAVARLVERTTGVDVVVLHEQPNGGRTIIEKFEAHARAASYAVINLTSDDVGRAANADALRPRGRQNVVFEMGFFFGALGRGRVAVLVDPNVEKPSDVDGVVYITFDPAGAWRRLLARDIEAAGIPVDHSRIP